MSTYRTLQLGFSADPRFSKIKPLAQHILVTLCFDRSVDEACFLSIQPDQIAAVARIDKRSVVSHLKSLEMAGLLHWFPDANVIFLDFLAEQQSLLQKKMQDWYQKKVASALQNRIESLSKYYSDLKSFFSHACASLCKFVQKCNTVLDSDSVSDPLSLSLSLDPNTSPPYIPPETGQPICAEMGGSSFESSAGILAKQFQGRGVPGLPEPPRRERQKEDVEEKRKRLQQQAEELVRLEQTAKTGQPSTGDCFPIAPPSSAPPPKVKQARPQPATLAEGAAMLRERVSAGLARIFAAPDFEERDRKIREERGLSEKSVAAAAEIRATPEAPKFAEYLAMNPSEMIWKLYREYIPGSRERSGNVQDFIDWYQLQADYKIRLRVCRAFEEAKQADAKSIKKVAYILRDSGVDIELWKN